jgi:hypothetical protein
MWTEIILSMALYVGPFAVLPVIIRRQPAARSVAVLAWLVAPLISAGIYFLENQKFSLSGLLLAYLIAMFPLGFWAALIGALATPLMFYLRKEYGQASLLIAAPISGAVIGSVFSFGFVHLSAWIQQPTHPVDVSFYVVCGLTSGSVVGLLAAWLVERMPSHDGVVT